MMKVSAMLVMVLGVIMLNRGFSLSGISLTGGLTANAATANASGTVAKIEDGAQVVTTQFQSGSYTPFIVQKGFPVKWTVRADAGNINGCNGTITIPKYNISKTLQPGDNVIEFTPQETGSITYTCWMGMISSTITVVPDVTKVTAASQAAPNTDSATAANGGAPAVGVAKISGREQEVTITVGNQGYTPAVVVLQKGIPAKIKFNVTQLSGCNSIVVFPELNEQLDLSSQTETPLITPQSDFSFQCGMGMLSGYVKVVDDLNKADLNAIQQETQNYVSAGGGMACCR